MCTLCTCDVCVILHQVNTIYWYIKGIGTEYEVVAFTNTDTGTGATAHNFGMGISAI